jgi:hypothetical protein
MTTFQTIIQALEFSNKPLVIKCLDEMKNGKIIFSPGFEQTFDHLYKVYKMRYQTAQELKKSSFNDEEITGWSKALYDLENSKVEVLSLSVVQSEAYVYYIFLNPTNLTLITIFGGRTNKPLSESISLNDENFNRGLTVSCIVYEFGKIVHEWKSV